MYSPKGIMNVTAISFTYAYANLFKQTFLSLSCLQQYKNLYLKTFLIVVAGCYYAKSENHNIIKEDQTIEVSI